MTEFLPRARQAFSFLREDLNFVEVVATGDSLVFESPRTYLIVRRDTQSGEVDVHIGLRAIDPEHCEGYSIREVAKLQGIPARGVLPRCFARSPHTLQVCLTRLAELVRTSGADALAGNRSVFLRLSDARIANTRRVSTPDSVNYAREQIALALESRDYMSAARLYAWFKDEELSDSERAQRAFVREMFLRGAEDNTGIQS